MQIKKEQLSPTKFKLTLAADQALLNEVKHTVLTDLAKNTRLQGFRPGKAPLSMVEKSADPQTLQTEVLQQAINRLYFEAVSQDRLRPVAQPQISITKFVPFTQLEINAEVEAVGEIKLPDYKKVKLAKPDVKVEAKDVNNVIEDLRSRMAEKKSVERSAKDGDEVVIDFKGEDAKTHEAIGGADAKDYELVLGSANFIPGFEDELVGLKRGQDKTFTLTFPKNYGVASLQNRKVEFSVKVNDVKELTKPKADDEMAKKAGPFQSMAELKADIKKQLVDERRRQRDQEYENKLLENLAGKTKVELPEGLIDEEISRQTEQLKQNIMYRGQTWQEYLKAENLTEESYRDAQKPGAELRVKAGLMLSEIAEQEGIKVTPEELSLRLQLLKGQYRDEKMQAELDKPEARQEIANRLLTEKTVAMLTDNAAK